MGLYGQYVSQLELKGYIMERFNGSRDLSAMRGLALLRNRWHVGYWSRVPLGT